MPKLKSGDAAPDFALTDQRGKTVKLKDFRGKKLVVSVNVSYQGQTETFAQTFKVT